MSQDFSANKQPIPREQLLAQALLPGAGGETGPEKDKDPQGLSVEDCGLSPEVGGFWDPRSGLLPVASWVFCWPCSLMRANRWCLGHHAVPSVLTIGGVQSVTAIHQPSSFGKRPRGHAQGMREVPF